MAQQSIAQPAERPAGLPNWLSFVLGVAIVLGLAWLAQKASIEGNMALFGKDLSGKAIVAVEYPIWAAGIGLLASVIFGATRTKSYVTPGFRTELFLKTGLVLMGASVNTADIIRQGSGGMVQAVIMITGVFFFTWWVTGLFKLDMQLRALMSASVAICGVSAAIAASGAVLAKKEQLAYVTTLVILFAMPLMIFMPWAAQQMGLSTTVAGAWIGGNIDTTAAVVGAGAVHSEAAMKTASIVKMSQNALIGFAAFFLAIYWVTKVEAKEGEKPSAWTIWQRFPKFVLGFVAVSLLATAGFFSAQNVKDITTLRNVFLTMAFVSIGLEFAFGEIRKLGAKPLGVYALATVFNTVLGLAVAYVIFGVLKLGG
ncbi:MAG: YeiH family protein [Chloroflexota bacterium]